MLGCYSTEGSPTKARSTFSVRPPLTLSYSGSTPKTYHGFSACDYGDFCTRRDCLYAHARPVKCAPCAPPTSYDPDAKLYTLKGELCVPEDIELRTELSIPTAVSKTDVKQMLSGTGTLVSHARRAKSTLVTFVAATSVTNALVKRLSATVHKQGPTRPHVTLPVLHTVWHDHDKLKFVTQGLAEARILRATKCTQQKKGQLPLTIATYADNDSASTVSDLSFQSELVLEQVASTVEWANVKSKMWNAFEDDEDFYDTYAPVVFGKGDIRLVKTSSVS